MKNKILFCLMPLLMLLMAAVSTSCSGCTSKTEPKIDDPVVVYHDYDGVVQDFTAGVATIQALHRQTMYALNGGEYQWRNSKVTLNDDITAETLDDLHIVSVTDIYQLFVPQPVVQIIATDVEKGTVLPWPINDIWIEDASLNDAEIKITAEQALQRLKEWNAAIKREQNGAGSSSAEREQGGAKPNGVLPGGKTISLRLPVGPKKCNAQWVVGDAFNAVFIDAKTGEVSDWNPAFPRP